MNLKQFFILPLLIVGLLNTFGCATQTVQSDLEKVFRKIPDGDYRDIIARNTQNDKKYNGFHNSYEAWVTIVNNEVREALLQREGYFMQWVGGF